ncbi:2Fe-2S iron-sulfur cluster-binding protein [Xanthobacter sp. AM11]|uniref:2Fe-2S iron-sulfur cluster-binding protein n=1 Tax=Xanthobacter sp. AM11 TaxID=3380643 RepID=UPI0039BF08E4
MLRGSKMPKVTYILQDGSKRTHELRLGQSVMEGATHNGIAGVLAECGGACMCATCHVYIETPDLPLPPLSGDEDVMLSESAAPRQPNSRLSCQIRINHELDGLVVRIADNR